MAKTIRITYCGMDGEGATVAAAKQDAARQLEQMVDQLALPPVVIAIDDQAVLVAYAGKHGWGSRLLTGEHGQLREGQQYMSSGYADRRDAIKHAYMHCAQAAWRHAIEDDMLWLSQAKPSSLMDRDWRDANRELVEYFAWQRRYKAAADQGHNDNDARLIAGGLRHLVSAA